MRGNRRRPWGFWRIGLILTAACPVSLHAHPPKEQMVHLRRVGIHIRPGTVIFPPPGVWPEEERDTWAVFAGPAEAMQALWTVVMGNETLALYLGETDAVDLVAFSPPSSHPISPPPASPSGPSPSPASSQPAEKASAPSPSRRVIQDTLFFSSFLILTPESQKRLEALHTPLSPAPRRVRGVVMGTATPEGDPALNERLARWRALTVVRTLFEHLPAETDVDLEVRYRTDATEKMAVLNLEIVP